MKKIYLFLFSLLCSMPAISQNFVSGNLVIYRVGDGSAALTNAATPVFLDEYTPAGALVRSIALPPATFTATGNGPLEGMINRSVDGRYLVFTGYEAAAGTAAVAGTSSATVPRVIARTDFTGTTDVSTKATTGLSSTSIRSAASVNGSSFWLVGGGGGVRYITFGTTGSAPIAGTPATGLNINIYGGQLYVSSGTAGSNLATVGTGTPTTGPQTATGLPGIPTTANANQFIFFDLSAAVPGVDVLYFADEVAGIQKFSLVGSTWVANGGVSNSGVRGLTAMAAGGTVTLFSTTPTNSYRITDVGGYNASPISAPGVPSVAVVTAIAASNTAFRGIAFAPTQFVLPVLFSNVSVVKKGVVHNLSFTNETEADIVDYEIERSSDGRNFTALQKIAPTKNDGTKASYLYTDLRPLPGINMYRVKAMELSGKKVYSLIVKIVEAKTEKNLLIFSNPAKGKSILYQASLQPGSYVVTVRNTTGQKVYQQQISHSGGVVSSVVNLSQSAPGVYYLEIAGPVRYAASIIIE